MKTILKILLISALLLSTLFAQNKTLERHYVPVTAKMAAPPLFKLVLDEWTAFSYNHSTDEWRVIPFQFDPLNEDGLYQSVHSGIADANDEIIFMPKDAGDKAEAFKWINDEPSQLHNRIELEFSDPLQPGKKAWIYLYRNVGVSHPVSSYLEYKPGPSEMPAAYNVVTSAFTLGHDRNGWIDYLSFSADPGDLIDRFKLRLAGEDGVLLRQYYEITEDMLQARDVDDVVTPRPGSVRAFHTVKASILLKALNISLLPDESNFKFEYIYTPYAFEIKAETELESGLLALFGVRTLRQSLDFSDKAIGMKVFSESNPEGMKIDGASDLYNDDVNSDIFKNWVMASGPSGTVFFVVELSPMANSRRLLYYNDDNNIGGELPDGTTDTGDGISIGDMGILVKDTGDPLFPLEARLSILFKCYFIDSKNRDAAFGAQLMAWEQNPLVMTATEQTYSPTFVAEKDDASPKDFYLTPAYPNPYSSSAGGFIHFEINGRKNDVYDLVVYNVLGRRVARIKGIQFDANEQRTLTWDARDFNGEPLSPGVYFYQLNSGELTKTDKLIISH